MRPCVKPPFLVRDTEFGGPKPLFCIPLVARDLKQLLMQAQTARDLKADLVEWRADSYGQQEKNSFLEAAQRLRSVLERKPILFTLRISSEGGLQQIPQGLRIACIDAVLRSGFVDLVDLELCNGSDTLQAIIKTAHDQGARVIISFHDFDGTPANEVLLDKISLMVRYGADIAKIACMPRDAVDVLRLLDVTLSARKSFPSVALCTTSMAALGLLSRVSGFLYGSDMAFAAGAASSAPGQIAIAEARAVTETLLRNL